MKCANCFNCSGIMILKSRSVKSDKQGEFILDKNHDHAAAANNLYPIGDTWVAAHKLPVFAQCSGCGVAPLPKDQPHVIKQIIEEIVLNKHDSND